MTYTAVLLPQFETEICCTLDDSLETLLTMNFFLFDSSNNYLPNYSSLNATCVTQVIAPAVRHHTRNSLLHGRMARSIVLQFRYIVQGQILLPNHDIFPRAGKGNLVPHPRRNRCEGGHRRRVDGIIFSQPSEARIGLCRHCQKWYSRFFLFHYYHEL